MCSPSRAKARSSACDRLDRVTLWGVHDGMSWKNGYPVPGRTNYPLLFDRERRPKPALRAVLSVPRAQ